MVGESRLHGFVRVCGWAGERWERWENGVVCEGLGGVGRGCGISNAAVGKE